MNNMERIDDIRSSEVAVDAPLPWMQADDSVPDTNSASAAFQAGDASTDEARNDIGRPKAEHDDDLDAYIAVIIRDGLDRPIPGLAVKIDVPGAPPIETITTEHGAVVMPRPDGKGEATLHVRDDTAQFQEVCKIDPAKCSAGAVIVRSPKVVEKVRLQPHHAKRPASSAQAPSSAPLSPSASAAPASPSTAKAHSETENKNEGWFETAKNWIKKVMHPDAPMPSAPAPDAQQAVKAQAVNKTGNPIAIITGPECPNKDNLRLGRNDVYRPIILAAAKKFNLCPQAIAALIDAEAGKVDDVIPLTNPDGTPKLIKSGKHKGQPATRKIGDHWDPKSFNRTGAAGLTQFIESTWLGHTTKPGCYINEQCLAKGWVKEIKDKKGRKTCVFVLADGSTTDKPAAHKSDPNVRACLDQRFDAEWSIMAAADYGMANLNRLKDLGFKLKDLNDVEKAKLMYLMHHEGEPAGPLVIKNKLNELPKGKFASVEVRIRNTLVKQVGEIDAEKRIKKANGDVAQAYRGWLADYIDKKIDFKNFCCDANKFPMPAKTMELFDKIGGEK